MADTSVLDPDFLKTDPSRDPTVTTLPVKRVDEPPPTTTEPPPRVMTPERIQKFVTTSEEREKTADEAARKISESYQREADILQHKTETLRQPRQDVISSIDRELGIISANPPQPPAALPERPKLRYNLNEVMGPPGSNKPMNQWMDMITQLAAVSGRTPQERMLFAVNAFNGMIEGWAKGKQETFQQHYNEWKDQVEIIRDTETRRRQYIQDVLRNAKDSSDLKSLKLQLLGQEDGDALLVNAAQRKAWEAIDDGNEKRWKIAEQTFKNYESVDKALQSQFVENNPGIDEAVRRWFQGLEDRPTMGLRAGPLTVAADTRAHQIVNEEAARRGVPPEQVEREIANRRTDFLSGRAASVAGERSLGVRVANMELAQRNVAALIQPALEASAAVTRLTGFVPADRAIQAWQSGTNDVALARFGMINFQLAEVLARAVKPTGVLDVSLQQTLLTRLNTASSPEVYATQLQAMADAIDRESDQAKAQLRHEGFVVPDVPGAFRPPPVPTPGSTGGGATVPTAPARVRQNGHTYERQPDGSYKAID